MTTFIASTAAKSPFRLSALIAAPDLRRAPGAVIRLGRVENDAAPALSPAMSALLGGALAEVVVLARRAVSDYGDPSSYGDSEAEPSP